MKTRSFPRRRFLQTAATAATAALAAPNLLPSRVWGAETPPSERLTLGFIGVGKQARGHLEHFLRNKQTQVLAVCEVDRTRREQAHQSALGAYSKQTGTAFKGCEAYVDFRELLARKDIDAVVIGTPDHWHALVAIEAARAGKDIYCEKPLSLTIREAKEMVKATREHQRVFQTGSQQRSSKEFRHACELVRNGRIGKVQRVEVGVGASSKWCDLAEETMEPGLDWDLWLGPAPARPYNSVLSPRGIHDHFPNWRNYREYSGGMMTDWGAHHFDIAQWGLGMDESGPVRITPPADSQAQYGVKYTYANGVEVEHVEGNGVTFIGSEGRIYVNRGKFQATPAELDKEPLGDKAVRLYESNEHRADWLQCVRSRKKPICDVEIGARSVTVCHLGNLAYWYRRPLQWDPQQQVFVNDAEANLRWMDVCRRDPWRI